MSSRFDGERVRSAALLAALVFALAYGALTLARVHDRAASVWLANAVIVGIALRAPRRDWPALLTVAFGATLAANLVNHDPLWRAALLALINIVESAIVIALMARVFEAKARFDDGYVIVRFLLYAGVAGPLCGALLAAGSLAWIDGFAFATTLLRWYLADTLGLLTLGALFLAAQTRTEGAAQGQRIASWVGVILASGVTAAAFTRGSGLPLFAVAPVLLVATLRAPLAAAMTALVNCVTIAVIATTIGIGPIAAADVDPATRIYLLQALIASLLFVVLPVRALIGERDRLGGAIARSERLFLRIAEASPAGTMHFDAMGRPTFANQRWTDLTGRDRDRLGEDRWLEAFDPADRSAANSLWARARATLEPCSSDFRYLNHGSPAGFAELHLYPEVEDGRILGFVARLTDVTSRRGAEDALQEREARYRLVTENAQDVILRLGLDGRPLYVSGASLRVTGYAPLELVGRPLGDLIHPDDLPLFTRSLARMAEGPGDPSIEFRLRHRDGHFSWFELSQRLVFDRDGQPIELVASLRDIERRRRAEAIAAVAAAQLRQANRLLLLAEESAKVGDWRAGPSASAFDNSPRIDRLLNHSPTTLIDRKALGATLAAIYPLPAKAFPE